MKHKAATFSSSEVKQKFGFTGKWRQLLYLVGKTPSLRRLYGNAI